VLTIPSFLLDVTNNIWWKVGIMKLLVTEFSPLSCHFLRLGLKQSAGGGGVVLERSHFACTSPLLRKKHILAVPHQCRDLDLDLGFGFTERIKNS
jgi:hypothetical protein